MAEDFTWTTNSDAIVITGYLGPGGGVAIPDRITGLPVTRIGRQAFFNCSVLTNLTLGTNVASIEDRAFAFCTNLAGLALSNSVTTVGSAAFYGCRSLASLTLGGNVATIGNAAFYNCRSLATVAIPGSVTNIGDTAFASCTGLEAITVELSNPCYSSADGVLFDKAATALIQFPGGRPGNYIVPDRVTSIGDHALYGCSGLTSVIIGRGVTNMASYAVADCPSLTNVIVGPSLASIGILAFDSCPSLTQVCFKGNAPACLAAPWLPFPLPFNQSSNVTCYYLPGTAGWGASYADRPTAPWFLPQPVILNFGPGFGLQGNFFGFVVSWATDATVVVEASTNLTTPVWSPVGTNTLSDGWSFFRDPNQAPLSARFYRLRWP
jgi:hypothetical protein